MLTGSPATTMPPRPRLPTSPSTPISSLVPTSPAPYTLVWASHARWPLPVDAGETQHGPAARPLRISVLDSSFNPPTAAHQALASHGSDGFDAQLLALSVGNPDKGTIEQEVTAVRLEMMRQLGMDLHRRSGGKGGLSNVAVVLLQAPTFVRKSEILRNELDKLVQAQAGSDEASVRLTFLVGWDTLIRIFAPRYYQPPGPDLGSSMSAFLDRDDSSLACARRGDIPSEEEDAFLNSDEVKEWVKRGKVEMFDIEERFRTISSTEVRRAVKEERWEDVRRDVPIEGIIDVIKREGLYKD
ncbi:Nicotinamide mononucleotide adenylyltransferase [Rhodotorula toruloides]|nr:Nicotinamide mononucleotide adenylyltransferase [Rhodotorula toruloides]